MYLCRHFTRNRISFGNVTWALFVVFTSVRDRTRLDRIWGSSGGKRSRQKNRFENPFILEKRIWEYQLFFLLNKDKKRQSWNFAKKKKRKAGLKTIGRIEVFYIMYLCTFLCFVRLVGRNMIWYEHSVSFSSFLAFC